jgi:hypothetical protein
MTVESFLTRDLQVRFIDARNLATEAKLKLGITGYPSEEQTQPIIDEAISLFNAKPEEVKVVMRQLNASLKTVTSAERLTRNCSSSDNLKNKGGRLPTSSTHSADNLSSDRSEKSSASFNKVLRSIVRRMSGEKLSSSTSQTGSVESAEAANANEKWGEEKTRKTRSGGRRPTNIVIDMPTMERKIPNATIDMTGSINNRIRV